MSNKLGGTITVPKTVIAAGARRCRKESFSKTHYSGSVEDTRQYAAHQNPQGLGGSTVIYQGNRGQLGCVDILWSHPSLLGHKPKQRLCEVAKRIVGGLDEACSKDASSHHVQPLVQEELGPHEYVKSAFVSFKTEHGRLVGKLYFTSNEEVDDDGNRVVGVYTFSAPRKPAEGKLPANNRASKRTDPSLGNLSSGAPAVLAGAAAS
jgi:hypothetical protein